MESTDIQDEDEWGTEHASELIGVTMFYSEAVLDSARDFLKRQGYREYILNSADAAIVGVHQALHRVLGLPDWFGTSWDAYYEAFEGGSGIEQDERIAFVIRNAELLEPEDRYRVIDGAARHDREFLLKGGRLAILVQSDDAGLQIDPVGAIQVSWNRREQLAASRQQLIRRRTFDDIEQLDARSMQRLLMELETHDCVLSLVGASAAITSRFVENMSRRAGAMMIEDIDLAKPSPAQVAAARRKIVHVMSRLEESERIAFLPDVAPGD